MSEIKLTLDTTPAAAVAAAPAPVLDADAPLKAPEAVEEPRFTPEEQAQIDEFSKKIDVKDSNLVFSYGTSAQQSIAEFSDSALKNIKTKDLDEVGDMIAGLVGNCRASPPTTSRRRACSAGSRSSPTSCS